jgi:hypothetical protein
MQGDGGTVATRKNARLSAISALLAFIACNGLLALSALLAGIGAGFDINPHLQAGLISLFAMLTVFFVFRGYAGHGNPWPLALAAVGALVILATMYMRYSKLVESVALAALLIAAGWNWALARRAAAYTGPPD